jgi:hypothetical protein
MSNRAQVLSMIHNVIANINNAGGREQRFDLLEKAQILAGILQEVTEFENGLLTDLDVD